MIALCTAAPTVRQDGERIIASIPSGETDVEIALSYAQATRLAEVMIRVARNAIAEGNAAATAEVIPLKRKRKG